MSQTNFQQGGTFKKFNIHSQTEQIQAKYTGTGSADTNGWEWQTTIHRDTHASHVSRFNRLANFALIENEAIARVRYNQLQVEFL